MQKAQKGGLTPEHDRHWDRLDEFYRAYIQTMRRVGASEFYQFDKGYFEMLRDKLLGNLHLLIVPPATRWLAPESFLKPAGLSNLI
jgi:hypothetical protein